MDITCTECKKPVEECACSNIDERVARFTANLTLLALEARLLLSPPFEPVKKRGDKG